MPPDVERPEVERFRPVGTITLSILFVLLTATLWFSVWAILVLRGATT